jgi:hypothetical protein
MAKYAAKTTETDASVNAFIKKLDSAERISDATRLLEIFSKRSGYPAKMWGPAIIGFGSYHYKYKSGHEGDAPIVGFSPRKNEFSLYLCFDPEENREQILKQLGKCKSGKFCIYFKKLSDIDTSFLEKMISKSVSSTKERYKTVKQK